MKMTLSHIFFQYMYYVLPELQKNLETIVQGHCYVDLDPILPNPMDPDPSCYQNPTTGFH